MLRKLVCAAAVLALFISICLLPQTAAARRCPDKAPETLLSLYQNSDAIYIAAFDKIVEGKTIEETPDYTAIEISKHFVISSTLKGKAEKFFAAEDREYRYKNTAPEPAIEEPQADEPDAAEAESEEPPVDEMETEEMEVDGVPKLKSGDTVLLFVKEGDEPDTYELTDYRDGVKKLSTEHIAVYEPRIKELNAIFSSKKVDEMRLLEWVIKCAEDPATRWEGTFELLQSVQQAEWRAEAAERRKQRIAEGLPVEQEPEEEAETDETAKDGDAGEETERKNFDTSRFAKLLDANHKQTLANILLNGFQPGAEKAERQEYIVGTRELIELVKRWGDPRLLGFLLDSVRSGDDHPVSVAETMQMIGEILDDAAVKQTAERYAEIAYEDDDGVPAAEPEEQAEAEPAEETPENAERPADVPSEPAAENEAETAPAAEDEPVAKKKTNKELRAELLQRFLDQCDKAIAAKEAGNEEKPSN